MPLNTLSGRGSRTRGVRRVRRVRRVGQLTRRSAVQVALYAVLITLQCACASAVHAQTVVGQAPDDRDGGSVDASSSGGEAPEDPTAMPADAGDAGGAAVAASPVRGLLASPGLEGVPMKGIYFFPGEGAASNEAFYTAHPSSADDLHWNSDAGTRAAVIERIVATHANTLVMSYWGNDMRRWSPMRVDATSVQGVIDAVQAHQAAPIVIVPALESGYDPDNPTLPHWRFADDFPYAAGAAATPASLAPTLLARLRALCAAFEGRRDAWAQMYDREGRARYVVHVLRVFARSVPVLAGESEHRVVAEAFDQVASEIFETEGIEIGFTLDFTPAEAGAYSFEPERVGAALARSVSVLATQFFMSEVHAGGIQIGAPLAPPVDNNLENLEEMAHAKHRLLDAWAKTGLPLIYDVSPGFDGRFIWESFGTGFWGDNYGYTSDDWRNLQSAAKSSKFAGITFNTWNGYTEGYAAVPTLEHGTTIYDWLTDLYASDPRSCDHVEYEAGRASHRVTGAICDKWRELGGRQGVLGLPLGSEIATARGHAVHFEGGSVFRGEGPTAHEAHEVHGAILREYQRVGYDSSCLGLPVSDEEPLSETGRRSSFEFGVITFAAGQVRARCSDVSLSIRPPVRVE